MIHIWHYRVREDIALCVSTMKRIDISYDEYPSFSFTDEQSSLIILIVFV